eukprot:3877480-Amphidinium_carterae.2
MVVLGGHFTLNAQFPDGCAHSRCIKASRAGTNTKTLERGSGMHRHPARSTAGILPEAAAKASRACCTHAMDLDQI